MSFQAGRMLQKYFAFVFFQHSIKATYMRYTIALRRLLKEIHIIQ